MVYSGDLKSPVERHAGSSPASRTKQWSRSINGDAVDCKSAVLDMPGSIPGCSTIYKGSCMSKQEDVINKAYGNMPKEVGYTFDLDFVPGWRGFKYYWYKLIRKVTR